MPPVDWDLLRAEMPRWKIELANRMREEMTPPEQRVWNLVRDRGMGVEFGAQVPLLGYILDFFCPQLGLAIETDGRHHGSARVRRRDTVRDRVFREHGVWTLRFTASAVADDLPRVAWGIRQAIRIAREVSDPWIRTSDLLDVLIRQLCKDRSRISGVDRRDVRQEVLVRVLKSGGILRIA